MNNEALTLLKHLATLKQRLTDQLQLDAEIDKYVEPLDYRDFQNTLIPNIPFMNDCNDLMATLNIFTVSKSGETGVITRIYDNNDREALTHSELLDRVNKVISA